MEETLKTCIMDLCQAVKAVSILSDMPDQTPREAYFVAEYLQDMEYMLLQQLMTSTDNHRERVRILDKSGICYLIPSIDELAEDWNDS